MKNFTQFFKTTFILTAILLLGGGNVWGAWSWTGETPASGNSYYMYTKNQSKFLNDANGFDTNPTILWTIGGVFNTNYTLTSSNSRQFAMYRSGSFWNYQYNVVSNATDKTGSDVNMQSDWSETDKAYSLYRQSKNDNWSGDRNVATTTTGLKRQDNASNEWRFISADEKSVYDKRIISFSATANYSEGGTATVDVENSEVELLNYADRDNTHSTKATFTATPNTGKVFVGWSTDEEGSNIISHNKEYQATITNNWNEGQNSTLTLYAIFGDKFEPSITAEKYDLKVEEQIALTFTHTENLAAPVIGTPGVISYSDGVVTALAAGTSTLTFTQAEADEIKAKVIVLTFNVTKHDVVWSWNAGGAAYLFNTTINNILTLTEGNPSNISIVSDNELVAKVENGNLVIGKVAGTAHITVTAAKDNKWKAKEETFIVTPGHVANHVPYVPTEALFNNSIYKSKNYISWNGGENNEIKLGNSGWDDKYIVIPISGMPDMMHIVFDAGWACTGTDWYVYESETDDFSDKPNLVSSIGNNEKSRDISLNCTTRFIKIGNGKNGDSYIKNLSISEYKTLSAETPEAIETTLGDTESVSTNIVLTYANAGITINASVAGEGFSIDNTSVEGGIDVYGEETFVVSFDPTGKAAGEHSATVTFTDGDMRKEVVVTAHVLVPLSLVAMNNENGTDYYYATFSNADYAVEFGNDVEVYTVSVDGDRMTLYLVSNNQVPANNGVLIKSQSNNILYKYISSAAGLSNNMLQPGTGDWTTGDNCRFYRLAYYDYDNKTGLGFYYGPKCTDGEAFMCKAGTAYLAVPKDMVSGNAPARFLLGRQDVSTEIENMIIDNTSTNSSLADGKKVMVNGVLYIIRDGKTYDSFGRMVK